MLRKEVKLGKKSYPPLLGDREYKDGGREVWVVTRVERLTDKWDYPTGEYAYYGVKGRSS